METIPHGNEVNDVLEIDDVVAVGREAEAGTVQGILWALAIMLPIYVVIVWVLLSRYAN